MIEGVDLCFSFFNQYTFSEVKANIVDIEYYFNSEIATLGNPLIKELVDVIKNYNFEEISEPLFQSVCYRCGKTADETSKIIDEVKKWKSFSKLEIEPYRNLIRDVLSTSVIRQANRQYSKSPSEYLKFLKTKTLQTTDIDSFGCTSFENIDINTILADTGTDYVPSLYPWINNSFESQPGYEKSQMVIVVGCPGTGKSLWMMSEALSMAVSGRKVLYVALGDLKMKDFVVRLGAMYTGMSFGEVSKNLEKIYPQLAKVLSSRLEISINPPGKVSSDEILDLVKSKPDVEVVIVDYDSNIKGASDSDNMYNSIGSIYEKLYEIASIGKLLFVGSQPKVSCWGNSVLEMQDVGESSRKQHTADIIIGIGREYNSPNHLHTFKISKSRRGEEGVKDYTIRLQNGRFFSIPKGLYDTLKEDPEKKLYTQSEIEIMSSEYLKAFKGAQTRYSSVNTSPNNSSGSQQGQQQSIKIGPNPFA